jgi:hypothetical protein
MLIEEGLGAYRPTIIALINDKKSKKVWNFAILQEDDKPLTIIFTEESWLCAEAFHLKVPRIFAREKLSEEYSIKRTKFKGSKKLLG